MGDYFSAYHRVPLHSFACDCLIFPAPVVEKTILFVLNASGTLVEESLITDIWFIVVLAQLYSIDIYVYCMSTPQFDSHSFVVSLKSRSVSPPI